MSDVTVKRPPYVFRVATQSNAKTTEQPSHVFHVNYGLALLTIAVINVVYLQRDNPTDIIVTDPAGNQIQIDGAATTNRDTKILTARKISHNTFIARVEA